MMKSRTEAVCKLLDKELNRIEKEIKQNLNEDINNPIEEKYKVYKEKLLRYKKFFSYRKMILSYF